MVRAVERHNLVAACVNTRHANRIFNRICTAIGEENFAEVFWSVGKNLLGSKSTHVIGVGRCNRGQHISLSLNGLNDFRVLVSDVDVDQHAREIEVFISFVIPDFRAFSSRNNKGVKGCLCGPGMEYVGGIFSSD